MLLAKIKILPTTVSNINKIFLSWYLKLAVTVFFYSKYPTFSFLKFFSTCFGLHRNINIFITSLNDHFKSKQTCLKCAGMPNKLSF